MTDVIAVSGNKISYLPTCISKETHQIKAVTFHYYRKRCVLLVDKNSCNCDINLENVRFFQRYFKYCGKRQASMI